jgi:predicted DNA-binding transcriptional regulator AlpA
LRPTSAKNTSVSTENTLLIAAPWRYVGLSRSGYYRLMAANEAPKPVPLPGVRLRWRKSDLDAWVARLKPGTRKRRARRAAESATPAPGDNHRS